jgi:hypothetical protein
MATIWTKLIFCKCLLISRVLSFGVAKWFLLGFSTIFSSLLVRHDSSSFRYTVALMDSFQQRMINVYVCVWLWRFLRFSVSQKGINFIS